MRPVHRWFIYANTLAGVAAAVVAGPASAFAPSSEHAELEIPLPFQAENLIYGDNVSALTVPQVGSIGSSIGDQIGGNWSVHSWNLRSASPHYVLGSGAEVAPAISNDGIAESAARFVLEQCAPSLGLDPEQLRLETVARGAGKYAVHFQQTYDGLEVVGGRAHATFMENGRVFTMGSDFYTIGELRTVPKLAPDDAEAIAIGDLPQKERAVSTEADEQTRLCVLPYPTSDHTYEPRLAWKVTVVTDGRTGVWPTYVDAHTGEILWRTSDVHFADYSGTIDSNIEPSTYCNGEFEQAAAYMEVEIFNRGTVITDRQGVWAMPNADSPRGATIRFFGPYVNVDRASGGADATQTALASPGVPLHFVWDDTNSRQDERDVFSAVSLIHDWFETVDPGYSYSNARITANVGVAGQCNAFYNGSINFYNTGPGCSGAGCANTGEIQGIIFHEYGHGVQKNLLGSQGDEGLGEGNADVLANFLTAESVIGRGFCLTNCTGGIRNSDNNLQYPQDLTGEVHADGRIIAGVVWDVSENLQASRGVNAGLARAAEIWHFGRKLERPFNQPDQCLSMFIADDDNGNVFDGTPNFDAICQGVRAHDTNGDAFDCPEANSLWVDFDYTGSESGTQSHPYNSLFQANGAAPVGFTMKVRDGVSSEVGTLAKPGVIRAIGGVVRVGAP
ncbi:MAG: M36 family metallopeptidase [Candidatus Eisenbacteria bacterium]|uniref:M36 family metallopeptidase n=1 Tax=Eiseniibacteriota bacterium TaxID=2212470 RepID=A0A956RNM2_UNCEI|nr:M36 family metallopeptidase [Candidatus Eisenbacteria bacterium]